MKLLVFVMPEEEMPHQLHLHMSDSLFWTPCLLTLCKAYVLHNVDRRLGSFLPAVVKLNDLLSFALMALTAQRLEGESPFSVRDSQ